MRSFDEAVEFFETELRPELSDHRNRLRVARRERVDREIPFSQKVAFIAVGIVLDVIAGGIGATFVGILLAVGIHRFGMGRPVTMPHFDVKQELLGRTVRFLDPSLEYDAKGKVPEAVLADSAIFDTRYDRYYGEDRIRGKLGSTEFDLSEIILNQEYGDKSKLVFSGMLFSADFNKHFKSRTWLLPDATEKHLGFVGRALQSVASGRRGELVQLENPEFERYFRVYSTDPTEARYLLSPSLMRRLLELRQNVRTPMRVSLVGGKITVMIEHERNLFVPATLDTIDANVFQRWLGEVFYVTSLVEELDLNTRIWSKAPEKDSASPLANGNQNGSDAAPVATELKSRPLAAPTINPAAYTHKRSDPPGRRLGGARSLIEDGLAGHLSLGRALLVFGMGSSMVLGPIGAVLGAAGVPGPIIGMGGAIAWFTVYAVIWRCAPNTGYPGLTWFVRGLILCGFLAIASAFVGITMMDGSPPSTLPPRTP